MPDVVPSFRLPATIRPGLGGLLVVSLMAVLTLNARAQETVFADGFEALPLPLLDCERFGYPCSLADADPAALARVQELLQQCWDVRLNGTLDDVRTFLETQPDVVEVGGNYRFVSFRVAGMPPAIFDDPTAVHPKPEPVVASSGKVRDHASPQSAPSSADGASLQAGESGSTIQEVVGEDSNTDGQVDQKDIKRALVLAPYEWEFAPHDESSDIADRLELLQGYSGNVMLKRNPTRDDRNIAIEDWLALGNYDVVAISTHGSRECRDDPEGVERCSIWISSGVIFNATVEQQMSLMGATLSIEFEEGLDESPGFAELSLTTDFFRNFYGGTLDNQLLTFSACESANSLGSELAAALGGDDFVMTGWTEVVDPPIAFQTSLAFYEELAKGISAQEAFSIVAGLGLFPYIDEDGLEVDFEIFSPQGDDVRLIELPRLMYQDSEMPEGINIIDLVDGMVGDGLPDTLQLTVQIDGVTQESKGGFAVRYRVQEQEATGSYDLATAALVDGYEYRYEVTHDVALGFPLDIGEVPIEVIVDLPEGGDSRYTTTVFVASCYFSAHVSGDRVDFFDGPAQFQIAGDGSINFNLRSRGYIQADLATSVQANFSTGPGTPLVPGTYDVVSAGLGYSQPVYSGFYLPEAEVDCPTCGGSVTIDAYEEELSLAGSASFTMARLVPEPEGEEQPAVTLDVEFVAAFGSQFDGSSPYVQCSILYGD